MQSNLLAGHRDKYQIQRIIYVNSGSNFYTELPVDCNAGLYSRNNKGKTSSLAALKLFLLPEINFRNNTKKFHFKSGDKKFSDIQSYSYYFPSDESFLICEASNPMGPFCMILYRTNRDAFTYERLVVPKSYDDLRFLFWDADSDKNEGLGKHPAGLSNVGIRQQLTKAPYHGTALSDTQTIREAIYTRNSEETPLSRYCLVPMSSDDHVKGAEVIRALLGMAFDLGNASTDTLPHAIAAIINKGEYSASNAQGVIVDIDSAIDEFEKLSADSKRLNMIRNKLDEWQQLKTDKTQYTNFRARAVSYFQELIHVVEPKIRQIDSELSATNTAVQSALEKRRIAASNKTEAADSYNKRKNTIDAQQEMLDAHRKELSAAKSARSHLTPVWRQQNEMEDGTPSDRVLLELLEAEIEACKADLEKIEDTEKARVELEGNQKRILDLEKIISKKQQTLDNDVSAVDTLTSHAASVLISLNSNLGELVDPLSEEACNASEAFAEHIELTDSALIFSGQEVPNILPTSYDKEEIRRRIELDISNAKAERKALSAEISKLHTLIAGRPHEVDRIRSELVSAIAAFRLQHDGLSNAAGVKSAVEKLELKISEAVPKLDELFVAANNANQLFDQEKKNYETQLSLQDELRNIQKEWKNLSDGIIAIAAESQGILQYQKVVDHMPSDLSITSKKPSEFHDQVFQLSNARTEMLSHRDSTINSIQRLISSDIIETTEQERFPQTYSQPLVEDLFKRLESVFENLDSMEQTHKKELASHNMIALNIAGLIERTEGLISNFIKRINSQLEHCHISNLSKVTMRLALHEQFSSLIKLFKQQNAQQQHLMDRSFYDDLRKFQEQFYIRRTHQIDISAIIQEVSYCFERNGHEEIVPQSNGTNSMVNAVVLATLLKELIPSDLEMKIPVVFDEVGSLDLENLQEICNVVTGNDLTLFVANPTKNGVISRVIPIAHDLSIFMVYDQGVYGKAETIYFEGMEECLEDICSSDQYEAEMASEASNKAIHDDENALKPSAFENEVNKSPLVGEACD